MINQVATKLIFKPSGNDIRKMATQIDCDDVQFWKSELSKLDVGQYVAVGKFDVCGREISHPLIFD